MDGTIIIGCRDEVAWFAQQMEHVLRDNDHKSGWEHLSLKRLLQRLHQETDELEREIGKDGTLDGSFAKVIKEAADVANFAMMIAETAHRNHLDHCNAMHFKQLKAHALREKEEG